VGLWNNAEQTVERRGALSLEERLQPLMVRLRDSRTLAGADLMNSAMQVYAAARAYGSAEALEEAKAMLSQRFLRQTGKTETGNRKGRGAGAVRT
jgi:hypothetical protein